MDAGTKKITEWAAQFFLEHAKEAYRQGFRDGSTKTAAKVMADVPSIDVVMPAPMPVDAEVSRALPPIEDVMQKMTEAATGR